MPARPGYDKRIARRSATTIECIDNDSRRVLRGTCQPRTIFSQSNSRKSSVAEFQAVAKVGDIPEGQGRAFAVNDRMVAVFNDGGEHFAIDDFCPHMGAALSDGHVEKGVVACPWHAWRFCVRDGTWCDNPKIKIDRFELRIDGDQIEVLVPAKP